MSKNITTKIAGTVTLTAGDNPVLVSSSGYVYGAPVGIYGGAGTAWTIDNQGTIAGTGSAASGQAAGVLLEQGGVVTNEASAYITGHDLGIYLTGAAGTIVNDGTVTGGYAGVNFGNAAGAVNNTGLISGTYTGVSFIFDAGSVGNFGTISGQSQSGVLLQNGGIVTNGKAGAAVPAAIYGGNYGINVSGAAGTITNFGTVTSPGKYGVDLAAGGTVFNGSSIASTASIYGNLIGVHIHNAAGTVINFGSIAAGSAISNGIRIEFGGRIVNASSGTISGGFEGVHAFGGGIQTVNINNAGLIVGGKYGVNIGGVASATLTNSGTITDTNVGAGDAVKLGAGINRLVVKPGGVFYGGVYAVGTASDNTLELGAGASVGTLIGIGSVVTNFGQIQFDPGSHWFVSGAADGFAGTISGFALGDTIELSGVTASNPSFLGGVLTLDLSGGGTISLNMAGTFTGEHFVATSAASGTDLSLACFAEGTRIATERGMVAVESLREGDRACTLLDGKLRPIEWLGYRRVDCRRHPNPTQVWPICVSADVFGPGRPYRDLWLSPSHALFIDGVLIPVCHLVDGKTIFQKARDTVTYWHIELSDHTVLSAEGVPAESYLDTGNRGAFANGGSVVDLDPDFAKRVWDMRACAPLVLDGPRLVAVKRRVLARARALGHELTDDAKLRVLADDKELAVSTDGRRWRVPLPEATRRVHLVSRVWSPGQVFADSDDARTLGIAISRLWLDRCEVRLDDAVFGSGWRAAESGWRWTDGDARLTVDGARVLEFEVAMSGRYWQDQQPEVLRAA